MYQLSPAEGKLFGKYYGGDFIDDDQYWADALEWLSAEEANIPLPYQYNPSTVRLIHELLMCPAGECGGCCSYPEVPLAAHDLKRLASVGAQIPEGYLKQKESGTHYLDCRQGCPFLVERRCTVYAARPDACWLYPCQKEKDGNLLFMRVKCKPGMDVIRKVITDAVKKQGFLLLPNLMCITKEG